MLSRLFRRKAPPVEDALPRPSRWPSHAARAEARIARLTQAIQKHKARDPRHPKLAALRAELARLTGAEPRGRTGAVVDVPAGRLSAKGR